MNSGALQTGRPGALLLCLAVVVALLGCTGGPASAPLQQDRQAAGCQPLSRQKAIDMLVAISSARPSARVDLTGGEARDLFRDEAAVISEGWPADPLGWWRQDSWLSLELQPAGAETVAMLRHGDLQTRLLTRFRFACSGSWTLTGIGDEAAWYSPLPVSIPGQDGELTEATALRLVRHVLDHYGTPAMRTTATGAELERGRLAAIAARGGLGFRDIEWPGTGPRLTLAVGQPDQVTGRWLAADGSATGEQVRFERRLGRWQVADHTDDGRWAPPPALPDFADLNPDPDLLGFEPGKSTDMLDAVIPRGDETGDPPYLFQARQLFIAYDGRGLVRSVEARSGGTRRGVNVGDPVAQVLRLYGEPNEEQGGALVYRAGKLTLRFMVEPEAGSDRRVVGIVLAAEP